MRDVTRTIIYYSSFGLNFVFDLSAKALLMFFAYEYIDDIVSTLIQY